MDSAITNYEYGTSLDEVEYQTTSQHQIIPILEAIKKGGKESMLEHVGALFSSALNNPAKSPLADDSIEPTNQTDSEALYKGFVSHRIKGAAKFNSQQKWEGIVQEVADTMFIARLTDLTNSSPDEEAEFPYEEISEDDKKLIEVGAVFYWNIGYQILVDGQKRRSSIIRFRRLHAWTRKEIQKGKEMALETKKRLGW